MHHLNEYSTEDNVNCDLEPGCSPGTAASASIWPSSAHFSPHLASNSPPYICSAAASPLPYSQSPRPHDLSDTEIETVSVEPIIVRKDPVIIRGTGSMTLFGMSNRFNDEFPTELESKVAPEEFAATMKRINDTIMKTFMTNLRWLIGGCLCCFCTFGCSFWPVICLSKRTENSLHKLLEFENNNLYYKLGLRWRLAKQRFDTFSMLEYVLLVEFIPKTTIFQPD